MGKKSIKRVLAAAIKEAAEEMDMTYIQLLKELLSDAGGSSSSAENGTARTKPSEGPSEMAKTVAQLILKSPTSMNVKAYKLSLKTLSESDRAWVLLQLSNSPKISRLLLNELMDVR